nr:remorin-like [Ipomoea batatas]
MSPVFFFFFKISGVSVDSFSVVMAEGKAKKVPEPPGDVAQENATKTFSDIMLARVQMEKKMSLINAWEDSEKSKAQNKAQKKISEISSWERSKKANIESDMNKIEEKLERQKAESIEKLQNKIAMIHKSAEEKRAMTEAKRGEDILKAEEMAAKYHATRTAPNKLLGLF